MSDNSSDKPAPDRDPLLAALRQLPSHGVDRDGGPDARARLHKQARAAYTRSFDPSAAGLWSSSFATLAGKAAVPVLLAGIVGLYMTWAFAAATALLH